MEQVNTRGTVLDTQKVLHRSIRIIITPSLSFSLGPGKLISFARGVAQSPQDHQAEDCRMLAVGNGAAMSGL